MKERPKGYITSGPQPKLSEQNQRITRRRLLQGTTLALPAVLTLRSGGAAAASVFNCAINEANNNPSGALPIGVAPLIDNTNPFSDGYARYTLDTTQVFQDNANPGVAAFYFDPFASIYRNASSGASVSATQPANTAPLAANQAWQALLFYDTDGEVSGLGPGTGNTAAISAACFDSQPTNPV